MARESPRAGGHFPCSRPATRPPTKTHLGGRDAQLHPGKGVWRSNALLGSPTKRLIREWDANIRTCLLACDGKSHLNDQGDD